MENYESDRKFAKIHEFVTFKYTFESLILNML